MFLRWSGRKLSPQSHSWSIAPIVIKCNSFTHAAGCLLHLLTQLMVVGGVAENMALMQCQPCQLPGKPGMLQLLHWSVPSLLALGGDGGGVGDSSLLQSGLVQK